MNQTKITLQIFAGYFCVIHTIKGEEKLPLK